MLQNIILHNSFRPDILPVAWATEGSSIMLISLAKPSSTSIVCKCGLGLAQMFKKPEAKKMFFAFICIRFNVSWQRWERKRQSQSKFSTLHSSSNDEERKITWTRD